jgi:hyaluronan synthase
MTTLLILNGWRILYASDTLTATETPTTFLRWIRQQVRWARATHIESLQQPLVYLSAGPIFFFSALKRELGTLIAGFSISYYFFTGDTILPIPLIDYIGRAIALTIYNSLRNPDRTINPWLVAPAFLFNYIPLPAVQLWSLLTLTEDGWSTSMRKASEMRKEETVAKKWYEAGFMVVWMGIVGGAAARYLLECEFSRAAAPRLEVWRNVWMVVGIVLPAAWMYHLMIRKIF